MGDSDGSHSCHNMIHELTQENPEDPGSQYLDHANRELNGRPLFKA